MNESVFFNLGDAYASSYDFKEARRSAEIYKRNKSSQKVVIAQNSKNGEYAIYLADKAKDHGTSFNIKEEL